MKTFYVINRNDIREHAYITETDLPDIILDLLDRCYWLSGDQIDEYYELAETTKNIKDMYMMLDALEFDILDDKKQLIGYIAQHRKNA
jgi:hypothetical protein